MAGQRALLVLDNAASSSSGRTRCCLAAESCLVLVTSRRHLGDLPGTVVRCCCRCPAAGAGAGDVRAAGAPRRDARPEARGAGAAGRVLPLAISLLARVYARHPSWTLADLTAETRASMLTLTAETTASPPRSSVSYRYLDPEPAAVLLLARPAPGHYDRCLRRRRAGRHQLARRRRALDALHGEGLLTETGYRRYGMHDLLRRYARDRAAADPAESRDQHWDGCWTTTSTPPHLPRLFWPARPAPAGPGPSGTVDAVPDLTDGTQALAWARAERGNLLACLDHATGTGQHARVVALTAAMATSLRMTAPGRTPSRVTPPLRRPQNSSATSLARPTPPAISGSCGG